MSNYRPLYTLRAEHEYFDRNICRALVCSPTPTGGTLLHRRGMLFKQLAVNEWTVLYDADKSAPVSIGEVIELELFLTDPHFVLYTDWEGFHPDASHLLELPLHDSDAAEANTAIKETSAVRAMKQGFCTIQLTVTAELLHDAASGNPPSCTFKFKAQRKLWEYLFEQQSDIPISAENLVLEEAAGQLTFGAFELRDNYGKQLLRSVSDETVPMRERYGYRLKLSTRNGVTSRKQMLLRNVPHPETGAYLDTEQRFLRQICRL